MNAKTANLIRRAALRMPPRLVGKYRLGKGRRQYDGVAALKSEWHNTPRAERLRLRRQLKALASLPVCAVWAAR